MSKLAEALKEKFRTPQDALRSLGLPETLANDEQTPFTTKGEPKMATRKQALAHLATAHKTQADALRAQMASDAALIPVVAHLDKMAADALKAANDAKDDDTNVDLSTPKAKYEKPDDMKDGETMEEYEARKKREAEMKAKAEDTGKPDDQDEDETDEEYASRKKREAKADDKRARDKAAKDKAAAEKTAMDSAIQANVQVAVLAERQRVNAVREAENAVRPVIGDLAVAMDSAGAVYKLALDHLNVETKGVHESAFPALLKMATDKTAAASRAAPRMAMDAAALSERDKRFPHGRRLAN